VLAGPPARAGLVIDDFEAVGFDIFVPPDFDSICQGTMPPFHVASRYRCINLDAPAGGIIDAESHIDDPDDAVWIAMNCPGSFGTAELWWEAQDSSTMNLRTGGADRLVTRFLDTPAGANLLVLLRDVNGYQATENFINLAGGPFDWEIDFAGSNLVNVDLTQVERVTLYMSGSDDAIFELADIRTVRASAVYAGILADWTEFLYPIPSPPCDWTILDPLSSDNVLHHVLVSFDSVINQGSGGVVPARLVANASGPAAEANCYWEDPGTPFDSPRYVLRVELTPELAYPFMPFDLSGLLQLDDYSFAAEIPVTHSENGHVTGHSVQRVVVSRGALQDIRFDEVTLERAASLRGGGPEAYLLSFTVNIETNFELDAPLFEVHLEEDWAAGEAPTGVDGPIASVPAVAGNTLSARPAVTRTGTTLDFARPVAAAAGLAIFDVTGRRIREFAVSPGTERVHWDGTTRIGAPAPAGVYFVRLQEGSSSAATRVVRLR
jgi:hypothetical protein